MSYVVVDILRQHPSKIHLFLNGSMHIQKVLYLNPPNYCFACLSLAHLIKDYPLHKQETSYITLPSQNPSVEKQDIIKKQNTTEQPSKQSEYS
jgi:hypothetical protein